MPFLERGDPIQFDLRVRDLTQQSLRDDEVPLIIIDQESTDGLFQLEPLETESHGPGGRSTSLYDKPPA